MAQPEYAGPKLGMYMLLVIALMAAFLTALCFSQPHQPHPPNQGKVTKSAVSATTVGAPS